MRALAAVSIVCTLVVSAAAAADADIRALIDNGHWKQGRAALEPRVKANPNDADAAALLARVRQTYGQLDAALPLAETAVRLNPNNAEYHWTLAWIVGQQAQKASIFRQLGLAKRFRHEAEAAIAFDPKHIDARMGLISFYVQAPGIAGGDKKKAEQIAADVAQVDPAWGFIARARFLRETKADADFESLYRQARDAARSPKTKYEATASLINTYLNAKTPKWEAAEELVRGLIALDPDRAYGHSTLAIVCAGRQKWTELDTVLAEGEKTVPDNLSNYYQAGRIIATQASGDYARAEKYLRKFLTQEPEPGGATWAHAHWRLGQVFEKQGRKADAISEIDQAVRLKPDLEDAKKDLKRLRG